MKHPGQLGVQVVTNREHLHMREVSRGAGDGKRPIQVRQVGGSNMTLEGENHWMSTEDVDEERRKE